MRSKLLEERRPGYRESYLGSAHFARSFSGKRKEKKNSPQRTLRKKLYFFSFSRLRVLASPRLNLQTIVGRSNFCKFKRKGAKDAKTRRNFLSLRGLILLKEFCGRDFLHQLSVLALHLFKRDCLEKIAIREAEGRVFLIPVLRQVKIDQLHIF